MDKTAFAKLLTARRRSFTTTLNESVLELVKKEIAKDKNVKNITQIIDEALCNYLFERGILDEEERDLILEKGKR